MSELPNFDEYIKQQLSDFSPAVPPHVWENIAAKRKKRKPVPFIFSLINHKKLLSIVLLLLTIGTGGIILLNNLPNQATAVTNTANPKPALPAAGINTKQKEGAITPASNLQKPMVNQSDINVVAKSQQLYTKQIPQLFVKNTGTALAHTAAKKSTATIITTQLPQENAAFNDWQNNQPPPPPVWQGLHQLYYPQKLGAHFELTNKINNISLPPCPKAEQDAAGNKDYVEFYAGPDIARKSYNDTAQSVLLQKRKESTSFQSAYSAGFRYTRVFSNGVSVRSGINYSQVNEKFNYVQSNWVQVTYITDPVTGDTTGTFSVTGTRYKTTINRYHSVDVPFLLGFELGNGKVHANFNSGVIFNIYSWQKGETLDTTLQLVNFNNKNKLNSQYKSNIGAGLLSAASIYYKLNNQLHLLAEPYWRYNFSPMSKEGFTLQEKFSVIGLRLGLRLDLK
jgi:hypothetical protein